MNNFLNFIEEDISAKKTLIETLPTRTKLNKKKYNEKIDEMLLKYEMYKSSLLKYINSKNEKLKLKKEPKKIDKISDLVANLEHVRFVLNPMNTYVEKMGFDSLLYEINHYSEFQFESLNNILNEFIKKFELIKVNLNEKDFDYTCYVHEYMKAFLESKVKQKGKYEEASKKFDEIYWLNPNLIEHIELNMRSLVKVYKKDFEKYILKIQKELKNKHDIKNYDDCLKKLRKAYLDLKNAEDEDISDIILKANDGTIDISDYLADSKVRNESYTSLYIESINLEDEKEMDNFYENITKLRENLIEYSNYRQFIPLMMDFKSKYEKEVKVDKKNIDTKLKQTEIEIKQKEKELNKLNLKISKSLKSRFGKISKEEISKIKMASIGLANELYKLYKESDKEYFKYQVLNSIKESYTISKFLELYYSFDYFKKKAIKDVFKITNYEELKNMSDSFDLFAMNLNNVIMSGVLLFNKEDVSSVIVKKYRLSKINISDEDLYMDNIDNIINKINILLRIKKIENSETTVENIWFMTKVNEINSKI